MNKPFFISAKICFLSVVFISTTLRSSAAEQLPTSEALIEAIDFCDWKKTQAHCDQILRKHPDDAAALITQARLKALRGKIDDAISDCDKVLAANPRCALALSTRGSMLFESGRKQAARTDYKEYLKLTDSAYDVDTRYRRASALWSLNDRTKSTSELQNVLKVTATATSDADVFIRGLAQQRLGKFKDAIETLSKLNDKHPNSPRLLSYLAYSHCENGDYKLAQTELAQVAALAPNYVQNQGAWGWAFQQQANYSEAISRYDKAIKLDGRYLFALTNRGISHASLRQHQQAVKDFERVTALDPEDGSSWCQLANSQAHLENYDDALVSVNHAIKLLPEYASAYSTRAWIESEKGDHRKAHEDFVTAIRLDPKDASIYYSRGLLFRDEMQYDKSIADLAAAISINPKNEFYFCAKGCAEVRKGDYEKAIEDCTKSIEINANRLHPFQSRGQAYAALGKCDLALKDLTFVIDNSPSSIEALSSRAAVYQKVGNKELANLDRAKLKELQPTEPAKQQRGDFR